MQPTTAQRARWISEKNKMRGIKTAGAAPGEGMGLVEGDEPAAPIGKGGGFLPVPAPNDFAVEAVGLDATATPSERGDGSGELISSGSSRRNEERESSRSCLPLALTSFSFSSLLCEGDERLDEGDAASLADTGTRGGGAFSGVSEGDAENAGKGEADGEGDVAGEDGGCSTDPATAKQSKAAQQTIGTAGEATDRALQRPHLDLLKEAKQA